MAFKLGAPGGSASRRSFRLSPLEGLILALVVLGVLYLLTMWAKTVFNTPDAREMPAISPGAPAALMDRALAASEKVQAQLSTLEKEVAALKTGSSKGTGKGGGGGANLARLEKRVYAMEHKAKTGKYARRLTALEKRLRSPDEIKRLNNKIILLEKRLVKTEGLAALLVRMDRVEAALKDPPPAQAGAASVTDTRLRARVQTLEAELMSLKKASRDSSATGVDAGVLARLQKLEQQAPTAQASPQVEARLNSLAASQKKLTVQVARLEAKPPAAPKPVLAPVPQLPPKAKTEAAVPMDTSKMKKQLYKVRRGDTLYGIGRKLKVNAKDVRRWNPKLQRRRYLWVGETLVIYKPKH